MAKPSRRAHAPPCWDGDACSVVMAASAAGMRNLLNRTGESAKTTYTHAPRMRAQAVTQNAAKTVTLGQSVKQSFQKMFRQPRAFLLGRAYLAVLGVYTLTYVLLVPSHACTEYVLVTIVNPGT
jgi:hypothetical protein